MLGRGKIPAFSAEPPKSRKTTDVMESAAVTQRHADRMNRQLPFADAGAAAAAAAPRLQNTRRWDPPHHPLPPAWRISHSRQRVAHSCTRMCATQLRSHARTQSLRSRIKNSFVYWWYFKKQHPFMP